MLKKFLNVLLIGVALLSISKLIHANERAYYYIKCPSAEDIRQAQPYTMVNKVDGKDAILDQYYIVKLITNNSKFTQFRWTVSMSDYDKMKSKSDNYFASPSMSAGVRTLTCTYPEGAKAELHFTEMFCSVGDERFDCRDPTAGKRT